jgi:hypothetical protein
MMHGFPNQANKRRFLKGILLALICFSGLVVPVPGQIEVEWIDTTTNADQIPMLFFTNRPAVLSDDGAVDFADKYAQGTDTLTFGTYHFDPDSFAIKFRASYAGHLFYDVPREENFLYKVYKDLVVKKGVRHFEIVIPGFAKTFSDQRYNFFRGLKENYQDSLINDLAIIFYPWADEWRAWRYHKAKKSAEESAVDYFLFHNLLSGMLQDSIFMKEARPFTVGLTCTSMGNELLKRFVLKADERGIKLHKTYNHILMVGSDASWDSFEEGKGFDRLDRLTDSVYVFMNRKDGPLIMSQVFNMKKRLGRHGPRHPWQLPGFVQVFDMTGQLVLKDLSKLNHDYLLRNPYFKETLIKSYRDKRERRE